MKSKRNKRITILSLSTAVIFSLLLISCDNNAKQNSTDNVNTENGTEKASDTDISLGADVTGEASEGSKNTENKSDEQPNKTYDFDKLFTFDNSRYSIFTKSIDGEERYGIIDIDGNIIAEPEYTRLGWCPEHRVIYADGEEVKRVELDDEYAIDTHFGHGLHEPFSLNVYDNSQGKLFVIDYDMLDANVRELTQLHILSPFIDYNGDTPIEVGHYCSDTDTEENFCAEILDAYKNKGADFQYITKEGNLVTMEGCTNVQTEFTGGYISLCKNGKYGYINENGEGASDIAYEEANTAFEGRAWVKKDGKYEVITLG